MAASTIRDGRDLTTDLTATLAAGTGTDRTVICLVRCPPDRELQRTTTSALQAGLPTAALYDLGGGELAVVGPPGLERALARSLRQVRRIGVSWGTACWPADGDDPAVVLDAAVRRVGRGSRRHWVRRGVQVAAATSLVVTVLVPLAGADGRTADGAGGGKTVRLVGEDAPGTTTTNVRATSSAAPHVLPQSEAAVGAAASATAGGHAASPGRPASASAARPARRGQPSRPATPAAAPRQAPASAGERPQGPGEQPREESRGRAVESAGPNGGAQPGHGARPQPSQEPPAPAAPAQQPPAAAAPPPAEDGDRRAEERRRDEQRQAEEQRRAEERRADEQRRADARRADEERREDEARRAEEVRRDDEAPGQQAERRRDGGAGRRDG